jgi:hypothetical protein
MAQETVKINTRLAYSVICILLSGAISFNVWAVTAVYARPTEAKTIELIEVHSPFVADRNMILESLRGIREDIAELKEILRDN